VLILVAQLGFLVQVTHLIIVEQIAALSPRVDCLPELYKQTLLCSFFSRLFIWIIASSSSLLCY
jgi:cadmium resistance protein CadD (predicted permease)